MVADKLDAVKDGKLISLLKTLLKEIKSFVRSLMNQREVEIDKLPDNMTIGDIANVLAYTNSKLILPGYEVIYTTPDDQQFKTYVEASKNISDLAKSVEDVDLTTAKIEMDYINKTVFVDGKENKLLYEFIEKNKEFERAKSIIEHKIISANNTSPVSSGINDLEQLEKLASLKDKGIISDEEFQAKKKQLLGL
ncbi:MAG: SHOCT domain-containing protein [Richelia sp. SM2_1_7]|nr:SHOCT domain-containing protein [Richelia sp. SM2_1_7]